MRYKEIDKEALVTDYKNGMSLADLTKKYETNQRSLYDWLDRLGVQRRGITYKLSDTSQVVAMYNSGLSTTDIGIQLGISPTTVMNYMKKHGCKARECGWHLWGPKNPTKGKGHTEETKAKLRAANLRQFSDPVARAKHSELTAIQIANGKTGWKTNKLERRVSELLKSEGHKTVSPYRTGKYVWDFYIPATNTLVEANGTFWHADPRVYDHSNLYPVQLKKVKRDAERTTWARNNGYNLRVIWELDV